MNKLTIITEILSAILIIAILCGLCFGMYKLYESLFMFVYDCAKGVYFLLNKAIEKI